MDLIRFNGLNPSPEYFLLVSTLLKPKAITAAVKAGRPHSKLDILALA
jgi:hypothetical protein